jgi:uncharacterized protein YggE
MTRSAIVAVVLAAAALVAGCSGDDEGSDGAAVGGLESGAVAAGLSAESLSAGASVTPAGITVVGTGTVKVAPDVAEWSFGVQASADSAAAALADATEATERVVAALREAGITQEDLRTEQVSVYPRTGEDGLSVTGYDASNTVRATIRDLDRSGPTVDAAVAAGANQVYGPTLTVSDAERRYADAVAAAFDDAQARAEAIAAKAGVTLGAPIAIVEGGGGGPVPLYEATEAAAADVAIEPGTQDVGATLTVTFAIN